eukprot:SM000369S13625  [mRNA]  locus=s369:8108:11223:+ [translate_table: standard]
MAHGSDYDASRGRDRDHDRDRDRRRPPSRSRSRSRSPPLRRRGSPAGAYLGRYRGDYGGGGRYEREREREREAMAPPPPPDAHYRSRERERDLAPRRRDPFAPSGLGLAGGGACPQLGRSTERGRQGPGSLRGDEAKLDSDLEDYMKERAAQRRLAKESHNGGAAEDGLHQEAQAATSGPDKDRRESGGEGGANGGARAGEGVGWGAADNVVGGVGGE